MKKLLLLLFVVGCGSEMNYTEGVDGMASVGDSSFTDTGAAGQAGMDSGVVPDEPTGPTTGGGFGGISGAGGSKGSPATGGATQPKLDAGAVDKLDAGPRLDTAPKLDAAPVQGLMCGVQECPTIYGQFGSQRYEFEKQTGLCSVYKEFPTSQPTFCDNAAPSCYTPECGAPVSRAKCGVCTATYGRDVRAQTGCWRRTTTERVYCATDCLHCPQDTNQ